MAMQLTEAIRQAMRNGFNCAGYYGNPLNNRVIQHWSSLDRILYMISFDPKFKKLDHSMWVYRRFDHQIAIQDSHYTVLHLYKETVDKKLGNIVEADIKRRETVEQKFKESAKIDAQADAWWDNGCLGLN